MTPISVMTVAWSISGAASAMLGLSSLLLWLRGERELRYLLAATMAFAAAACAGSELALSRSTDVATYLLTLRIQVVLIGAMLLSLVWFVYLHFGSASRPLALAITALWSFNLVVELATPGGAVFSEITALERIQAFWGETFTIARGPTQPVKLLADAATVLVFVYLLHATAGAWRQRTGRSTVIVGAASAFFIVLAGIHTPMVDAGLVPTPYMISFAFLAIVFAMTCQIVDAALRAGRIAQQLDSRERRWQVLLEKLPLLVVQQDTAGRIQYVNPALLKTTGYQASELLGRPIRDLVAGSGTDRTPLAAASSTGATAPADFRCSRKDGEFIAAMWSSVALFGPAEAPEGTLSVGIDLTEQASTERDLAQTRRQMEMMSRATLLGEVAAGLAHEINQPLAAILSNAQAARRLLAREPPDLEEIRQINEDVIADGKRAGAVVHGLRAMLANEDAPAKRASLGAAVSGSVQLLAGELRSAGIVVSTSLDPEADLVCGDVVQIQQVLMNLILNAIRASHHNQGDMPMEIESARHGREVIISVKDRGSGIAPETMARMFEPFQTTRQGGLGVGLAISRRIVEGYGGRIRGENRPGGGAVISFALPLAEDPGVVPS
jgi:two-component system sensor kinase FixL